ncbi:hypothetical protein ncot_15220 [Nocardioides sp. JQ2195]|uniref:YciI family protein n=1 Tax=Nocardioides sp. JQ2195 TaxID=2592334 RepID=UPI00143E9309|nr:YciI family protein [Nocardioides sp. JQ2195]QIX27790.1 hypothetical protein ncot_15220 [Nocardioides sp. JQ2195]
MAEYLIFFNQQWVGDHPEEWYATRVKPSMAVMAEMKEAGVYVYAGGLEEGDQGPISSADDTSGELVISDGPYVETTEFLGGLTIIDVPDDEQARYWCGRVAQGCGWPQEVRKFKPRPPG